jgi:hypothetical protein
MIQRLETELREKETLIRGIFERANAGTRDINDEESEMVSETRNRMAKIKSQLERIEKVRQDPEKDEHDVRKQEEVLAEYTTAKPFEQGQLHGYFTALEEKVLEALEDDDLKATEEFSKGVEALNAAAPVLIECGKLEQEDWDATLAQLPAVATPPPPAPA